MNKKIHICLVGGEDAHKRIDLSRHLLNDGFAVTILGTKDYDYPEKINFIKYDLNRSFNPFSDFKTVRQYKRIFSENTFDIVQTFDTKPAFLVPIAAYRLKVKIVRTITGLGKAFVSKDFKSAPIRFLYVFLHYIIRNRVSHTTFQNSEDRDIFLKNGLIKHSNHSMIYGSGIDLTKIGAVAPRKHEPFTAICVSRLIYEKGIVNFLEAAKICHAKGYHFKFLLVGPLEENSKKLNKNLIETYSAYVDWLGVRSDIYDLLRRSDTFVLPTWYREGFARVLLEASAMGLPLITTDVAGVRDIARHEKEALIVDTNNSNDLAEALIRMGTDKNLADKLSENALINVKLYSLAVISKNYSDLYKNTL
ncbi:glycosyltransferase family 4 protein [Aggregatimonas sangjinii]|uniref:Glycosyltransferase family 4 protein n=1 Tax=Aggregatimonas sangjinii TaxID=2583587 RepID=A0A5B7SRP3_9FLAO|nr:glycosyltransferase family 4 protein [Aggregatimonas sangjinii]QCW99677.1 glycosyltransferase family 4 protein [Aggregatimonas sangjinii]